MGDFDSGVCVKGRYPDLEAFITHCGWEGKNVNGYLMLLLLLPPRLLLIMMPPLLVISQTLVDG